jgi:8-oxo-dGTP diphosphatase
MGIILFIIAVLLFKLLFPIAYGVMWLKAIFSKSGARQLAIAHKRFAIEIDELGNLMYADILNLILIKSNGYKFGHDEETISSVLGKNKMSGTLSDLGYYISWILNKLDKNHVEKSIKNF